MHAIKSIASSVTGHRKEEAAAHGTSAGTASRFPHTFSVRVGELALGTSLPETLARGKFHPYLLLRLNPATGSTDASSTGGAVATGGSGGGMGSMIRGIVAGVSSMMSASNRSAKTNTITNGWNSSTSAYALTFNETFTLDGDAAADSLEVALYDDNLLKDTRVASGFIPLRFLTAATAPAGSSSGPVTIPLHATEHARTATGGMSQMAIGNVTLFINISHFHAGASHGAGMAAASTTGATAAAAAAGTTYADPRSTVTMGGGSVGVEGGHGKRVGDADALGRRDGGPTILSGGTSALPGQSQFDFVIHNAMLDFAVLESAFGYKHANRSLGYSGAGASTTGASKTTTIDPYILIRINDNPARGFRTSTIKDPSTGCAWEQTLRVWFDSDDKINVYLVDDNLFKDTFLGYHTFTAAELASFGAGGAGGRSFPLYAYKPKASAATGTATGGTIGNLFMDIVPAHPGSIGADTGRSSLLIAAGEASHLGSTIVAAGGGTGTATRADAVSGTTSSSSSSFPAAAPPAYAADIATKPTQHIRVHGAPAPVMPAAAGIGAASDMGGFAAGGGAAPMMTTHTASTAAALPGTGMGAPAAPGMTGGGMGGEMTEVKPVTHGSAGMSTFGAPPPSLTAHKVAPGSGIAGVEQPAAAAGGSGLRHMDANTYVAQ